MDGFSGFAHAVCVSDDSHYGVVFYQAGNAEPEGVCYQVAGLLRGYYFYVYRVGYGVGGDSGRSSGAALFAANPWVNLLITAIFVAFALALFGLFEIRLPYGLLNKLNQVQGGSYGAILIMGFTFSLTSFTCTAPFVGTLLVLTAQGTWVWPILGMLVFSAAFASPFFFLALFPQALSSLPQSGGWLNSVKVVMGFLELAAALKFLSNVDLVWQWGIISREVFIAGWIAIFFAVRFLSVGQNPLATRFCAGYNWSVAFAGE